MLQSVQFHCQDFIPSWIYISQSEVLLEDVDTQERDTVHGALGHIDMARHDIKARY